MSDAERLTIKTVYERLGFKPWEVFMREQVLENISTARLAQVGPAILDGKSIDRNTGKTTMMIVRAIVDAQDFNPMVDGAKFVLSVDGFREQDRIGRLVQIYCAKIGRKDLIDRIMVLGDKERAGQLRRLWGQG